MLIPRQFVATTSSTLPQRRATRSVKPRRQAKKPATRGKAAPAQARSASSHEASGAEHVSSVDQIAAGILRGLYDGRYVGGQKLIESELSRRFNVGRGTVREALRRLAAEGYVTVSLHKGASIRALGRADVLDMLDVLEVLCGLTARRAAENLSGRDDEDALRAMMSSLTALAATGDSFEFGRMRDRFYRLLVQLSQNREVGRLLAMVNVHLIRVRVRSDSQKERLEDYHRIIDAVVARDGARAERFMRQHIRNAARAIEQLPEHEFDG